MFWQVKQANTSPPPPPMYDTCRCMHLGISHNQPLDQHNPYWCRYCTCSYFEPNG